MKDILFALLIILMSICATQMISKTYKIEKYLKIQEKEHEELQQSYELCGTCASKEECPAAFTGVSYPCEHFKENEQP